MKKKRIDFRDLKGIMSKKEMMHVLGGSGTGSGLIPDDYITGGIGTGSGTTTGCCTCNYRVTFHDDYYGDTTLSGTGGLFCGSSGCSGHDCCWDAAEAWMVDESKKFGIIVSNNDKFFACTPN